MNWIIVHEETPSLTERDRATPSNNLFKRLRDNLRSMLL